MIKVTTELTEAQYIEYTAAAAAVYDLNLSQFIHCELFNNYSREKLHLNEPDNRTKFNNSLATSIRRFNIALKDLKKYV